MYYHEFGIDRPLCNLSKEQVAEHIAKLEAMEGKTDWEQIVKALEDLGFRFQANLAPVDCAIQFIRKAAMYQSDRNRLLYELDGLRAKMESDSNET